MTAWTLDQVLQAASLRTQMDLDLAWVGDPEATRKAHRGLYAALCAQGRERCPDLDLRHEDVQFRYEAQETAPRVTIRCRWFPDTTLVEIAGGARDGMHLHYSHAPEPLMVACLEVDVLDRSLLNRLMDVEPVEHRGDGWDPEQRCWIYRGVSKRE